MSSILYSILYISLIIVRTFTTLILLLCNIKINTFEVGIFMVYQNNNNIVISNDKL